MEEKTNYQVGLYLRLSKDDMQQGESVSISTQRAILTDYCNKHQLVICKIYADDGYSGTNFDRPGFRALLEDVEVDSLVVRVDLSTTNSVPKNSVIQYAYDGLDTKCNLVKFHDEGIVVNALLFEISKHYE